MMMTMTTKKKKKSTTPSRKSIKVCFIPNDVIINILSMLSARYLLRLRWTCKYWFNLITGDPSFIKMHLHQHQSIEDYPTILIHNPKPYREGFVQYNFNDDASGGRPRRRPSTLKIKLYDHPVQQHEYNFLGSCNGLLLMSLFLKTPPDEGRVSIFIWNPCTKEFKTLPDIPIEEDDKMNSSDKIYGFGYDHIIDDYKVISVPTISSFETVMAIYTLGTNSWRRVGGFPPYSFYGIPAKTIYNGALYSFVTNRILNQDVLLSFDIVKEECKELSILSQLPRPTRTSGGHILGELKGCLCLFVTLWNSFYKVHLELWVLKKDEHNSSSRYTGESWTKSNTITKQEFIPDRTVIQCLQPLRICNNGEILVMVNQRYVVWYNPEDDKTRFVATVSPTFNTTPIGIYIESLVSLNTGDYMGQEQLRRRIRVDTKEEKKNDNKRRKSS